MLFSPYRSGRQALTYLLALSTVDAMIFHLLRDECVLLSFRIDGPANPATNHRLCKDLDEWGVGPGAIELADERLGIIGCFPRAKDQDMQKREFTEAQCLLYYDFGVRQYEYKDVYFDPHRCLRDPQKRQLACTEGASREVGYNNPYFKYDERREAADAPRQNKKINPALASINVWKLLNDGIRNGGRN